MQQWILCLYNTSFQIIYRLFSFRTRNSFWTGTSTPFSNSKSFKVCPALSGTVPKNINESVVVNLCSILVILLIWKNWSCLKYKRWSYPNKLRKRRRAFQEQQLKRLRKIKYLIDWNFWEGGRWYQTNIPKNYVVL